MAYINCNEILFSANINIGNSEINPENLENIKKAIVAKGGNVSNIAALDDIPLAILNIPVGDMNYLNVVDSEVSHTTQIFPEALDYAMLNKIGGATKWVSLGKNLINPAILEFGGNINEENFSKTINADGTITYTTISDDCRIWLDIRFLPLGKYYAYIEGNVPYSTFYFDGETLEIDCTADFEDRIQDYRETTRTLKVMIWRDENATADGWEVVEAPEGTVFEPFISKFENIEIERVESISADGNTLLDTFTIPEAVRNLDGFGMGIDDTYCNSIEIVDGKVSFIKRCEKIILNGSEDWTSEGNAYFALVIGEYGMVVPHTAVCDQYDVKSPATNTGKCISVTNSSTYNVTRIMLRTNEGNVTNITIDKLKAQLAEKPITLIYALANPIATDITPYFSRDNLIKIMGGGSIRFVNENDQAVPNEITYIVHIL